MKTACLQVIALLLIMMKSIVSHADPWIPKRVGGDLVSVRKGVGCKVSGCRSKGLGKKGHE